MAKYTPAEIRSVAQQYANDPNALQTMKDKYGVSDADFDAAMGAGAAKALKAKTAYGGTIQRSGRATDQDVARTLSGGFDITANDPYALFQAALLNKWSPEQAAQAGKTDVGTVNKWLADQGLSLDQPVQGLGENSNSVRGANGVPVAKAGAQKLDPGIMQMLQYLMQQNPSANTVSHGGYDAVRSPVFDQVGTGDSTQWSPTGQNQTLIYGPRSGGAWSYQSAPVFDENGNFIDTSGGDSTALGLAKFIATSIAGYNGADAANQRLSSQGMQGGLSGIDAAMADMGAGATNVGGVADSITELAATNIGGNVTNLGTIPPTAPSGAGGFFSKLATDPNLWKLGLGAVSSALTRGGDGINGPDLGQVTPQNLIPYLQQQGQQNWQRQLDASRYDVRDPNGSSTWSQVPNFNQGAYDQAMAAWNQAGGASSNLPQPTRDQFTSYAWTNTSTLSPQNQALKNANDAFKGQIAQWLPGAAGQYAATAQGGANRSNIPGFDFSKPTTPTFQNPTYGNVQRGQMQSSVQPTARDWAGNVGNPVTKWSTQLAERNPWSYDQQGADAAFSQQTRYLLPQQKSDTSAMEARLAEQGFVPGTPGYSKAMTDLQNTQQMALGNARDSAIQQGRQFGDQAFDNQTSGLSGGIQGMLNFAGVGLNTDQAKFGQNLSAGQFRNTAQQQDFAQQMDLSARKRQEGLDANQVAQNLYSNQVQNQNNFNNTVAQANQQANQNFQTDLGAQRNVVLDALNAQNTIRDPQAPGAAQSNVPGANQPDIAGILKTFFDNNVDIKNANTASSNANTQSWMNFLAAIMPALLK